MADRPLVRSRRVVSGVSRGERIPAREITPETLFLRRRELLRLGAAGLAAGGAWLAGCGPADAAPGTGRPDVDAGADERRRLGSVEPGPARFQTDEAPSDEHDVTHYNNFYEFGTDKEDPARYAGSLHTDPWSVVVEGEAAKTGKVALEDLLRPHTLQERTYRFRCVEAWSMVVPWIGIPLRDVLRRFEPGSRAKFVAFQTLYDPEQMPGQRRRILDWPYREGLRIDEAMHPLALLAVGMYGKAMPNQNGAPLRLVVPWKYGFKSIKSIVRIRFQEEMPQTSWNEAAPREYGFYSNVNPDVDHPRWSQARERRLGEWTKRPTLFLNGYAEQVASLYAGMDLRKNF